MKHLALALSLSALLAAPLAASAQTCPEGASLPHSSPVGLDAQAGQITTARLAPVNGQPNTLQTIADPSTRPSAPAKAAAQTAPGALTSGQEMSVYNAYFREQFIIPPGI